MKREPVREITAADVRALRETMMKQVGDRYALAYISAMPRCADGLELAVQCEYILNNLRGWRGEQAREIKAVLHYYKKQVYTAEGY